MRTVENSINLHRLLYQDLTDQVVTELAALIKFRDYMAGDELSGASLDDQVEIKIRENTMRKVLKLLMEVHE